MNKISLRWLWIATFGLCTSISAFAGTGMAGKQLIDSSVPHEEPAAATFPFEFHIEGTYAGRAGVIREDRLLRYEQVNMLLRAVYTPRVMFGILRLGAEWDRYWFDMPDPIGVASARIVPLSYPGRVGPPVLGPVFLSRPQVPDVLQSVSAIIGLDTQLGEAWLVRLQLQPGLYGTEDLGSHTLNMPIIVGGTYIHSPSLQFIFGASIDWERKYPVFPGGGVRWRFAPQWVLDASMPSPRLNYEMSQSLTLYVGGHLRGGSFRVGEDFGNQRGDRRLNKATLTYFEVRTGAGIEWKISPEIRLTAEGGYMPFREFDYHRADVRYRNDSGAPYGMLSLSAAF